MTGIPCPNPRSQIHEGETDRGRQGSGQQGRRQETQGRRQEGRREVARFRPTPADLRAAVDKKIEDVIAPGLRTLFVGINPGLWSGATGHHFARPGNRFWRAIYDAGLTPTLLTADRQAELLHFGLGVTNLVNRTTATAVELTADELREGGQAVGAKVERYRPRKVAFLGVSAYRIAFIQPKAAVGRQAESIGTSEIWLLPNPSGLNAHYQLADLARVYAQLMVEPVGYQVVVYARDPHALAHFWAEAMGYQLEDNSALIDSLKTAGVASEDDIMEHDGRLFWRGAVGIRHPGDPVDEHTGIGRGRRILFEFQPTEKVDENRVHLDLNVGRDRVEEETRRLRDLGATLLYERRNDPAGEFNRLTDPEGNEFCLQ